MDRSELPGMEFDWLATDENGCLAQLFSSGVGRVPEVALSSEEKLFALHLFLDELPITEPLSIPGGTFQALLAQPQRRGLFVYDAVAGTGENERSGEYTLIASPTLPLTLDRIPEALRGVVCRLPRRFADSTRLEVDGI